MMLAERREADLDPLLGASPWGRSHRRSRRSDDLPGGLGNPVLGPRVTGEPLEPDAVTRNAQRPKGEKRQLASRMLGIKPIRS